MTAKIIRDEKQKLILQAYNYNSKARQMASSNQLYMGSAGTALLFQALGSEWPGKSLADALAEASDKQLDAGLMSCANIIKHMKR